MNQKPVIAITMGDPGGIGPEIILKSLKSFPLDGSFYLCLIGNKSVFQFAAKRTESSFKPHFISSWDSKLMRTKSLNFFDIPAAGKQFQIGKVSRANGLLSFKSLKIAAREAACGKVQAIVTAPIHKQAVRLVKHGFTGHTEYLAKTAERREFAMLFYSRFFCVTLVTIHLALKDVPKEIRAPQVFSKIKLTHQFLKSKLRISKPKIAVACLNPHGEEFGREENRVIAPAVRKAKRLGIRAHGPLPGDQVFHDAYKKRFDAVIAMYHDQGLAPFKMIAFDKGVNVTIGLPYVRTSPDHGTAFDIAYQNKANPASFLESLRLAKKITV